MCACEFGLKLHEENKHNPSDKLSANHERAQGLKDPNDSLNTPQKQGNTLSIQGNTSPANQAQARGSMGPTTKENRLNSAWLTHDCHKVPLYQSPKQRRWPGVG
jgi:hypothetical protein